MLLSLCMIVKDEEKNLAGCLQSVQGLAGEIVLVDTGSRDRTEEIAAQYGAKIFHFPWNDSFADARNESLAKASGEWALIMDADDRLEDGGKEKILSFLRSCPESCDVVCCRTVCFVGKTEDRSTCPVNLNVRLIRTGRGYRFRGRIHEQVVCGEERLSSRMFCQADITFYHYGYLDREIRQKNKHARNLRLIRMELREEPPNAFLLFCMGNEFLAVSQFQRALCCFRQSHLLADLRESYTPALLLRMIVCCDRLNLDRERNALTAEGLNRYPRQAPDFLYLKACALYRRGKTHAALNGFRRCAAAGKAPLLCCSISGSSSYQAEYSQAVLYARLGEPEKAVRHCLKAIRMEPLFRPAYRKAADLLAEAGFPAPKIAKRLSRAVPRAPEPRLILSEVLFDKRMYREALSTCRAVSACQPAEKTAPFRREALLREGACRFYLSRYRDAARTLLRAADGKPCRETAWLLLLCSLFGKGKLPGKEVLGLLSEPQRRAAETWVKIMRGEACAPFGFGSPEEDSRAFADPVFRILESLLACGQGFLFEASLPMLDLLDCPGKLLRLGKLYDRYGFRQAAWRQTLLSIQMTGEIDAESIDILQKDYPYPRKNKK